MLLAAAGLVLLAAGPPPDGKPADPLADMSPTAPSSWQDIRVQVVPRNAASLGAPMSGRLADFPLRDGDVFKAGQVLARFVCGEQEGSLAHARAVLQEKREVLATNSKLRSLGTSSGLEFQVAVAQVAEADADVQTQTAVVDNCAVKAPFGGRVASVSVRPFQFVTVGAPLIEILDDKTLDLEMIVPSRWMTWLHPGTPFGVALEETGKTYRAVVDRMSGKVDAVSQSIKVYGRLVDPAPELLAGMSGRAILDVPPDKVVPGQ
jgi:RND family efflux transporter MFP subunit